MIKDKEWLKEEINGVSDVKSSWLLHRPWGENWKNDNLEINKGLLFNLIDELYEPEKIVIPKFVADWIEKHKGKFNLRGAFSVLSSNSPKEEYFDKDVSDWLCHTDKKGKIIWNHNDFALAWINGYEVGNEPLYYVLDEQGNSLLYKGSNGDIVNSYGSHITMISMDSRYRLTEEQIKSRDERFMVFAVPFEEATE